MDALSESAKAQKKPTSLDWAKEQARKAKAATEKSATEKPVQLFLPGMQRSYRAEPNHFGQSSLFAPIARGRRTFLQDAELVTRGSTTMRYTGEQLDEADATLSMQLTFEARCHPLGRPVTLNRAALLRALGRTTGKDDYEWLHRRMKALTVATLFIETKKPDGTPKYSVGTSEAFHIVQSFRYDDSAKSYTFTLDPRWSKLFSNREFALIDMERRLQISRGQDMAKALQRLIATSSNSVQRYGLEWLKGKMQYSGRMRDFHVALRRAMQELIRVEIAANGRIEPNSKGKDQLTIWRQASG